MVSRRVARDRRNRSLRLVETAEIKLVYSPLFFPAWLRMAIVAVI